MSVFVQRSTVIFYIIDIKKNRLCSALKVYIFWTGAVMLTAISLAGSVGTCRCDVTRTEKISQPIKKLVTGDMLRLSFVEGACSHERMPFEPELSQASNYGSGEDV